MKFLTKKLIIIISSIVVLAGGGVAVAAVAGDSIANSFHLMVDDDRAYFEWLMESYTEETADMLELSENLLKDSDLSLGELTSTMSKPANARMDFCYGDDELLSFVTHSDKEKGELFLEIPSYKEGALDLSGLLPILQGEGESTLAQSLPLGEDAGGFLTKIKEMTPKEHADLFREIMGAFTAGVKEVKVEKDFTTALPELEVDYNKVMAILNEGDVYEIVKEIIDILVKWELIDETTPDGSLKDVSGEVTLYVTGKAKLTGLAAKIEEDQEYIGIDIVFASDDGIANGQIKLEADINAVKVELSMLSSGSLSDIAGDLMLRVNGLEAMSGKWTLASDEETGVVSGEMVVATSDMVSALIGLDKELKFKITTNYGGEEYVTEDDVLYDYTDALEGGYITLGEVLRYAFRVIDTLDNDMVYAYVDEFITSQFGSSFTYDMLKAIVEMGLFDGMNPFAEGGMTNPF